MNVYLYGKAYAATNSFFSRYISFCIEQYKVKRREKVLWVGRLIVPVVQRLMVISETCNSFAILVLVNNLVASICWTMYWVTGGSGLGMISSEGVM